MGTRCGDLDPSVETYIMQKENLDAEEIENILNKESGAYGISCVSVDFRDIEAEANEGDHNSKLALEVFHETVAGYITKCMVAMNGVDVITFTAGVGEKGQDSRQAICDKLAYFGVELDREKNQAIKGDEAKISSTNSKIEIYVVPTNEELMMAQETIKHIKN